MQLRNRYFRRSHLSEAKFRQLARLFALDSNATDAAELLSLERKTVTVIYQRIRQRLRKTASVICRGQRERSEVDDSYFGPRRVRGNRGRGASGKTPVTGLRKR